MAHGSFFITATGVRARITQRLYKTFLRLFQTGKLNPDNRKKGKLMEEKLTHNDQLPVYNIKAVSHMVGLLPVTLRAWERRYGLPTPSRGDQGYRLYSEHDLLVLHWLKRQIESGLSIGRAVEHLHEMRRTGQDPAATPTDLPAAPQPMPAQPQSPSIRALQQELLAFLLQFDEANAGEVMRRAFALYSVDQVLMDVVTPALVQIGDMWHQGKLPIAVEHYATQFCMQHLMSMLAASAPPAREGLIVAACAPGETHQIGLLILVVMLRWRGWNVKYLGPDLKLERMEEALGPMKPNILMFTANRVETAKQLDPLPAILARFPPPRPLIVVGGQAFDSMRLPDSIPAIYIQASPVETVKTIEKLMLDHTHPQPSRAQRGLQV
jgi:MerR family transcriptional regulator, light-induced transcriptional regulator